MAHLIGTSGNDNLVGGTASDIIQGNGGSDTIRGGDNVDFINGNDGNDLLYGDAADDFLYGDAGDDTIQGRGDDYLSGGKGNDILRGGAGADKFVFYADEGQDIISDFADGTDKIRIFVPGQVSSLADVTMTASGVNTVLDFAGTKVTVYNIAPSGLDASDFIFT